MKGKTTASQPFFGDLMQVSNINKKFTGTGGSRSELISDQQLGCEEAQAAATAEEDWYLRTCSVECD